MDNTIIDVYFIHNTLFCHALSILLRLSHFQYFVYFRLTRIKIEDSTIVSQKMQLFQDQDPKPVDLTEFAGNLNVSVENDSLVSLFKMHLEVIITCTLSHYT